MSRSALIIAVLTALVSAQTAHGASVKNGQVIFSRCAICHTVVKGGPNGIGPDLFGIVGRKAASSPTFVYSGALKSSGITWTNDKLSAWVSGPQKLVPGNRMAFSGLTNMGQVADVVAYLDTLK